MTTFRSDNSSLFSLPREVLSDEGTIRELIARILTSGLPFHEQWSLIEQQELTPFITGSTLRDELRLLIEVEDDLSGLRVYNIDTELSRSEINGDIDLSKVKKSLLVDVPNPRLIYSAKALSEYAVGALEREAASQLFTLGRRVTSYRGVVVTWDQSIDRRVWTTNIDTVHIINELSKEGVFSKSSIRSALELGVGGSAISKSLVSKLPNLKEMTVTDISPYALMCARRNIQPILEPEQSLNLFLGKGLRTIAASADLIVVNPPYIPSLQPHDAVDPYRGTGLISEVVELGASRLNASNPDAAIYLGMSSLADRDFAQYRKKFPELRVERIGDPLEVPLKILKVNENRAWLDFLVRDHGLQVRPERLLDTGFQYWHTIYLLKLMRG